MENVAVSKECGVGFRCKVGLDLTTIIIWLGVGWIMILLTCIAAKQPYSWALAQNTYWVPPFVGNLEAVFQMFCGYQGPHIELHLLKQVWPSVTHTFKQFGWMLSVYTVSVNFHDETWICKTIERLYSIHHPISKFFMFWELLLLNPMIFDTLRSSHISMKIDFVHLFIWTIWCFFNLRATLSNLIHVGGKLLWPTTIRFSVVGTNKCTIVKNKINKCSERGWNPTMNIRSCLKFLSFHWGSRVTL